MSSFQSWCFVLLFAVMLAPGCAKKSDLASASPSTDSQAAAVCDGALFHGQCVAYGQTVTFGQYPQASETPEPISWIVIDVVPKSKNADGRILLLSQYVIDAKPYDTSHKNSDGKNIFPTWAESDIRKWLNDTGDSGFLRSPYFTAQEQSLIVEVTNSTVDYHQRDGGVDTRDKVFLLDAKQYESYLHYNLGLGTYDDEDDEDDESFDAEAIEEEDADDEDDEINELVDAKATAYAIQKGAYVQNLSDQNAACTHIQCSAHWWLRSPASHPDTAATAELGGGVFFIGDIVTGTVGIRPALWVRAD